LNKKELFPSSGAEAALCFYRKSAGRWEKCRNLYTGELGGEAWADTAALANQIWHLAQMHAAPLHPEKKTAGIFA
jgi:hypothetical protein